MCHTQCDIKIVIDSGKEKPEIAGSGGQKYYLIHNDLNST